MPEPSGSDPTLHTYSPDQLGLVAGILRDPPQHPTNIGPYHVLEVLGQGGMGIVYKAEQREPIQRVVALKIIKRGLDTDEFVARFRRERQALALMSHPNVAQVYDAGATDAGRPYLVMEYVQGKPITEYCDSNRLDTHQRLELFIQACEAVAHAHQKSIVHRDLKPSNILVTAVNGRPTVKVIDFGIAKALRSERDAATVFTQIGLLVGTPEYMSPEQAQPNLAQTDDEDIDTRTDIYSLGVVLYEILAGALPFDSKTLRRGAYEEIRRIIREVDPPRPSTRLSGMGIVAAEIAERRRTEVAALGRLLRNELEWIPLKAMRKDRAERYGGATELAEDIRAYLENRPLRAAPESTAYFVRKFVRRHKAGVGVAGAFLILILTSLAAVTWLAYRATQAERIAQAQRIEADTQRRHAEASAEAVRVVNKFLTDDLLASASPESGFDRNITVREAVDIAARSVAQRFSDNPLTEAAIRSTLSGTYDSLGTTDVALPHAKTCYEIRLRELGSDHPDTLAALYEVARLTAVIGRFDESETMLRDVLARSARIVGAEHPITLNCKVALAMVLRQRGRLDEAEPLYREGLEGTRKVFGPYSYETGQSLNSLGMLAQQRNRLPDAEQYYRDALVIFEKRLGPDHPARLVSLSNLATVLQAQRKLPEAEITLREVLVTRRRVLGDDHPATLTSVNNLGHLLSNMDRFAPAEALYREALERRRKVFGEQHVDTLQSYSNLAALLVLRKKLDEAETLYRIAVDGRVRVLGEQHVHTVGSMASLASLYDVTKRYPDAAKLYERLRRTELFSKLTPNQQVIITARYGVCLTRLERYDQAESLLLEAEKGLRDVNQALSDRMYDVLSSLLTIAERNSLDEDAAKWRARLAVFPSTTHPATQGSSPATAPATQPSP